MHLCHVIESWDESPDESHDESRDESHDKSPYESHDESPMTCSGRMLQLV